MLHIAILVPVCSRGQFHENMADTPLCQQLLPSIASTISSDERAQNAYTLFVGVDDDDVFYMSRLKELMECGDAYGLPVTVLVLSDCSHHPVRAWNRLFEYACDAGCDYFLQVGDDVELLGRGWTTKFVRILQSQHDLGTVGPCSLNNYWGRKLQGQHIINENNFVHRTHHDIFGYFFHPQIRNWHCDDWITLVYGDYAHTRMDVHSHNAVQGSRYRIEPCTEIEKYVAGGECMLRRYMERNLNTFAPML